MQLKVGLASRRPSLCTAVKHCFIATIVTLTKADHREKFVNTLKKNHRVALPDRALLALDEALRVGPQASVSHDYGIRLGSSGKGCRSHPPTSRTRRT
jgi:hypothetical protein